jgi:hypothetical protein
MFSHCICGNHALRKSGTHAGAACLYLHVDVPDRACVIHYYTYNSTKVLIYHQKKQRYSTKFDSLFRHNRHANRHMGYATAARLGIAARGYFGCLCSFPEVHKTVSYVSCTYLEVHAHLLFVRTWCVTIGVTIVPKKRVKFSTVSLLFFFDKLVLLYYCMYNNDSSDTWCIP